MQQTERDFQGAIVEYAHLRGWLVAHFRPAQTGRGWRTAMQGDVGYPDLTMARGGRVVFAEVKSERGRLSAYQIMWQDQLDSLVNEYYIWRPSDWDEMLEVLR